MSQPTKPKRTYNSALRQAQAHQTRLQILATARELFVEYGYSGATIDAIAQEAGVAPETVFAIFGSKRSILASLVQVSVGGDEQPIPLMQRPGPQAVLHEQDPQRQVRRFAEDISGILERVAPLFEVMRMAAKTEPEIAGMLQRILDERRQNLAVFVKNLAAYATLRTELDEATTVDTVWAITSPEMFSLLTRDRGWSRERYADWLGDSLARLVLD
jgi:AcrR family transcriptional regulator